MFLAFLFELPDIYVAWSWSIERITSMYFIWIDPDTI
jgi:hypothetical protein